MTTRGIEMEPVRNAEGIIIGFDLSAEASTEERSFVQTLPRNLATNRASFSFSHDSITISNPPDYHVFRLPPEDVAIIKEYIDTLGNGTLVEPLRLKGFGSTIEFRFTNEDIVRRYS
jgi:hypothetical protein